MLAIFWDSQEQVYCDLIEDQRTINSQYYFQMLEHKFKPAIKSNAMSSWQKESSGAKVTSEPTEKLLSQRK